MSTKNKLEQLNDIAEESIPEIKNSTPVYVYYHLADQILQQVRLLS